MSYLSLCKLIAVSYFYWICLGLIWDLGEKSGEDLSLINSECWIISESNEKGNIKHIKITSRNISQMDNEPSISSSDSYSRISQVYSSAYKSSQHQK